MQPVEIDGNHLTLDQIEDILDQDRFVKLSESAILQINKSREVIEHIVRSGSVVYGVNTGFGKFSDVQISAENIDILQENLVKSHASGIGEAFSNDVVKTMLLLKANGLAKGYSGVRLDIVETLVEMFNRDVLPVVPEKGSVGSSGDLAPLAHLALVMIGLGEAEYQGERLRGAEAMKRAGIPVVKLHSKEGLAILNGTQTMTAVAAINSIRASNILESADIVGAMSSEVLLCTDGAFDARIHRVRHQEGQQVSAENLRTLLKDSPLVKSHIGCKKVQDAYSVRCMPQVHGASRDAAVYVRSVVEREINAATDNPLVFSDHEGTVISGGNFHGQPVALSMDFLAIAMSEIGSISERRIAWMMDANLSDGLPAFLAKDGGLNSGYMIAQYAAAALVSENKSLCHPASIDSIPTSANKEDHVSMGTIGARQCLQVIQNVEHILGIEWLCATQAADFRKPIALAPRTAKAYALLRDAVPILDKDRVTSDDIEKATALLRRKRLVSEVWD
ncbi:MAG: histidine ammonia-lyase [Bacteroidetes bacterium]|nr:histidine ammonia-lyase [Bacteroidota bacterium]